MNNLLKKILGLCLVLAIVFSVHTKQVVAIVPVEDVLTEGATAAIKVSAATLVMSNQAKDTWDKMIRPNLNRLAYQAMQLLLNQITENIISWIRGGFEGSPSFAVDPEQLFYDLADMERWDVVNKIRGIGVCRFDPTFQYKLMNSVLDSGKRRPERKLDCPFKFYVNEKGESCELGEPGCRELDATQMGERLVDTTVFTGWNFFESLVKDGGNAFGLSVQVNKELKAATAERTRVQEQRLANADGFLDVPDIENCTYTDTIKEELEKPDITEERRAAINRAHCSTKTPGKLVGESLTKATGIDMDRLGLADNIDKIATAFLQQLMNTAIDGIFKKNPTPGQSASGVWDNPYSFDRGVCVPSERTATEIEEQEIATMMSSSPIYIKAEKDVKNARAEYDAFKERVDTASSTLQKAEKNLFDAQQAIPANEAEIAQRTASSTCTVVTGYVRHRSCGITGCHTSWFPTYENRCEILKQANQVAQQNLAPKPDGSPSILQQAINTARAEYEPLWKEYTEGDVAKKFIAAEAFFGEAQAIAYKREYDQYFAGENALRDTQCEQEKSEKMIEEIGALTSDRLSNQSASTIEPKNITRTSVTLVGKLATSPNPLTAWFEWGTDKDNLDRRTVPRGYGLGGKNYEETITGLTPNTIYYYQAKGFAARIERDMAGDVFSFTTKE